MTTTATTAATRTRRPIGAYDRAMDAGHYVDAIRILERNRRRVWVAVPIVSGALWLGVVVIFVHLITQLLP